MSAEVPGGEGGAYASPESRRIDALLALAAAAHSEHITSGMARHEAIEAAIRGGASYRQLADSLGLSVSTVHYLVNGRAGSHG